MAQTKRPKTMETLGLTLQLLKNIPARAQGGRSATELHQLLPEEYRGISLRSVQRHLAHMVERLPDEIAVNDSSRPHTFHRVGYGPSLHAGRLSEAEALLLCLAQRQLAGLLPVDMSARLSPLFDQARTVLIGKREAREAAAWLGKVSSVPTSQPLLPAPIDSQVFNQVSTALFSDRILDLQYRNESGIEKAMRVEPLALTQQGPLLYLVCRSDGYPNPITLLVHRILSAAVLSFRFERPADFDLGRYTADGQFGYGDGKRISLRFHISAAVGRHLLETPLSCDQSVTEDKGGFIVSATVVESVMLVRWLRGFGNAVRVLAPQSLKRKVQQI